MTQDKDIVATADPDAPEILEEIALDQAVGGAQYGNSNSCEPVPTRPRHALTGVMITSYQFHSSAEMQTSSDTSKAFNAK